MLDKLASAKPTGGVEPVLQHIVPQHRGGGGGGGGGSGGDGFGSVVGSGRAKAVEYVTLLQEVKAQQKADPSMASLKNNRGDEAASMLGVAARIQHHLICQDAVPADIVYKYDRTKTKGDFSQFEKGLPYTGWTRRILEYITLFSTHRHLIRASKRCQSTTITSSRR